MKEEQITPYAMIMNKVIQKYVAMSSNYQIVMHPSVNLIPLWTDFRIKMGKLEARLPKSAY